MNDEDYERSTPVGVSSSGGKIITGSALRPEVLAQHQRLTGSGQFLEAEEEEAEEEEVEGGDEEEEGEESSSADDDDEEDEDEEEEEESEEGSEDGEGSLRLRGSRRARSMRAIAAEAADEYNREQKKKQQVLSLDWTRKQLPKSTLKPYELQQWKRRIVETLGMKAACATGIVEARNYGVRYQLGMDRGRLIQETHKREGLVSTAIQEGEKVKALSRQPLAERTSEVEDSGGGGEKSLKVKRMLKSMGYPTGDPAFDLEQEEEGEEEEESDTGHLADEDELFSFSPILRGGPESPLAARASRLHHHVQILTPGEGEEEGRELPEPTMTTSEALGHHFKHSDGLAKMLEAKPGARGGGSHPLQRAMNLGSMFGMNIELLRRRRSSVASSAAGTEGGRSTSSREDARPLGIVPDSVSSGAGAGDGHLRPPVARRRRSSASTASSAGTHQADDGGGIIPPSVLAGYGGGRSSFESTATSATDQFMRMKDPRHVFQQRLGHVDWSIVPTLDLSDCAAMLETVQEEEARRKRLPKDLLELEMREREADEGNGDDDLESDEDEEEALALRQTESLSGLAFGSFASAASFRRKPRKMLIPPAHRRGDDYTKRRQEVLDEVKKKIDESKGRFGRSLSGFGFAIARTKRPRLVQVLTSAAVDELQWGLEAPTKARLRRLAKKKRAAARKSTASSFSRSASMCSRRSSVSDIAALTSSHDTNISATFQRDTGRVYDSAMCMQAATYIDSSIALIAPATELGFSDQPLPSYAVVVGISYKFRSPTVAPLDLAAVQARAMGQFLTISGFRTTVLLEEAATNSAIRKAVREATVELQKHPQKGRLVVYLNGRGWIPPGAPEPVETEADASGSSVPTEETAIDRKSSSKKLSKKERDEQRQAAELKMLSPAERVSRCALLCADEMVPGEEPPTIVTGGSVLRANIETRKPVPILLQTTLSSGKLFDLQEVNAAVGDGLDAVRSRWEQPVVVSEVLLTEYPPSFTAPPEPKETPEEEAERKKKKRRKRRLQNSTGKKDQKESDESTTGAEEKKEQAQESEQQREGTPTVDEKEKKEEVAAKEKEDVEEEKKGEEEEEANHNKDKEDSPTEKGDTGTPVSPEPAAGGEQTITPTSPDVVAIEEKPEAGVDDAPSPDNLKSGDAQQQDAGVDETEGNLPNDSNERSRAAAALASSSTETTSQKKEEPHPEALNVNAEGGEEEENGSGDQEEEEEEIDEDAIREEGLRELKRRPDSLFASDEDNSIFSASTGKPFADPSASAEASPMQWIDDRHSVVALVSAPSIRDHGDLSLVFAARHFGTFTWAWMKACEGRISSTAVVPSGGAKTPKSAGGGSARALLLSTPPSKQRQGQADDESFVSSSTPVPQELDSHDDEEEEERQRAAPPGTVSGINWHILSCFHKRIMKDYVIVEQAKPLVEAVLTALSEAPSSPTFSTGSTGSGASHHDGQHQGLSRAVPLPVPPSTGRKVSEFVIPFERQSYCHRTIGGDVTHPPVDPHPLALRESVERRASKCRFDVEGYISIKYRQNPNALLSTMTKRFDTIAGQVPKPEVTRLQETMFKHSKPLSIWSADSRNEMRFYFPLSTPPISESVFRAEMRMIIHDAGQRLAATHSSPVFANDWAQKPLNALLTARYSWCRSDHCAVLTFMPPSGPDGIGGGAGPGSAFLSHSASKESTGVVEFGDFLLQHCLEMPPSTDPSSDNRTTTTAPDPNVRLTSRYRFLKNARIVELIRICVSGSEQHLHRFFKHWRLGTLSVASTLHFQPTNVRVLSVGGMEEDSASAALILQKIVRAVRIRRKMRPRIQAAAGHVFNYTSLWKDCLEAFSDRLVTWFDNFQDSQLLAVEKEETRIRKSIDAASDEEFLRIRTAGLDSWVELETLRRERIEVNEYFSEWLALQFEHEITLMFTYYRQDNSDTIELGHIERAETKGRKKIIAEHFGQFIVVRNEEKTVRENIAIPTEESPVFIARRSRRHTKHHHNFFPGSHPGSLHPSSHGRFGGSSRRGSAASSRFVTPRKSVADSPGEGKPMPMTLGRRGTLGITSVSSSSPEGSPFSATPSVDPAKNKGEKDSSRGGRSSIPFGGSRIQFGGSAFSISDIPHASSMSVSLQVPALAGGTKANPGTGTDDGDSFAPGQLSRRSYTAFDLPSGRSTDGGVQPGGSEGGASSSERHHEKEGAPRRKSEHKPSLPSLNVGLSPELRAMIGGGAGGKQLQDSLRKTSGPNHRSSSLSGGGGGAGKRAQDAPHRRQRLSTTLPSLPQNSERKGSRPFAE